jgi:hypothetical protein
MQDLSPMRTLIRRTMVFIGFLFYFATPHTAFASSEESPNHITQALFPIAGYSSKTGIMVGGMYLNEGPFWKSNSILFFSQKYGNMVISTIRDVPFPLISTSSTLESKLMLFNWKDSYFPCGDSAHSRPSSSCQEQLLDNSQYEFELGVRQFLTPQFSYSGHLTYTQRTEYPNTQSRIFENERNFGLTTDLQYDSRNDFLSPNHGTYLLGQLVYFPAMFRTSMIDLMQLTIDARIYRTRHKHTIALRGLLSQTLSPIDSSDYFTARLRLGNQRELRGESNNRYMGRAITLLQSEYRYRFYSRLSGILFIELGQAQDTIGFNHIQMTRGFGLHTQLNHGVVFRSEAGFSRDTFNIIISFNTAF